jgi:hypothetical protein
MAANRRDVVPHGPHEWAVTQPEQGVLSTHPTQADAERAAKESLRGIGGEVVIHGRDGVIRDADTVAPGRDPSPPRDTRH